MKSMWNLYRFAQLAMVGLLMLILSGTGYAEKMYVSNVRNVTLRTGPGTDHKVVQMLQSGSEIEMMESGGDWSHVQTDTGKEGWILSRFLTPEMPSDLKLAILKRLHEQLQLRANDLEEKNKILSEENRTLKEKLSKTSAALQDVTNRHETLRTESKDFLNLKAKYEAAVKDRDTQTARANKLNDLLLERNIKIGLLGAGILFFGFLVGFSTRKQRRRSSLL